MIANSPNFSSRNHIRSLTNSRPNPNRGGLFPFFCENIGLKNVKNRVFCVLFRPMGATAPHLPWLRYWSYMVAGSDCNKINEFCQLWTMNCNCFILAALTIDKIFTHVTQQNFLLRAKMDLCYFILQSTGQVVERWVLSSNLGSVNQTQCFQRLATTEIFLRNELC